METINLDAAETQLARLVAEAAAGNEIVITRAGQPVAKLVPFADPQPKPRRLLGALRATLRVPPDINAPLPNEVLVRFEGA